MRYLWMLSLLFAMGTGCTALHVPQSEVLMLERGAFDEDDAAGLSLSTSMISPQLVPYGENVLELDETERNLLMPGNMYGVSLLRTVGIGRANQFWMGLWLGYFWIGRYLADDQRLVYDGCRECVWQRGRGASNTGLSERGLRFFDRRVWTV